MHTTLCKANTVQRNRGMVVEGVECVEVSGIFHSSSFDGSGAGSGCWQMLLVSKQHLNHVTPLPTDSALPFFYFTPPSPSLPPPSTQDRIRNIHFAVLDSLSITMPRPITISETLYACAGSNQYGCRNKVNVSGSWCNACLDRGVRSLNFTGLLLIMLFSFLVTYSLLSPRLTKALRPADPSNSIPTMTPMMQTSELLPPSPILPPPRSTFIPTIWSRSAPQIRH